MLFWEGAFAGVGESDGDFIVESVLLFCDGAMSLEELSLGARLVEEALLEVSDVTPEVGLAGDALALEGVVEPSLGAEELFGDEMLLEAGPLLAGADMLLLLGEETLFVSAISLLLLLCG